MKIAKLTDRFKVNLGEVTVTIAPLSGRQKLEMTSLVKQDSNGKLVIDKIAQELYLIKHSVKGVTGLNDMSDHQYVLHLDDNDNLTDECADELLGFLANTFFTYANTQALRGYFGQVVNPFNNEPLKGVTVERIIKEEDEKK